MIRTLQVVVDDGSVPAGTIVPLRPFAQRIDIPRGEDSVIRLVIRKPDGTRVDLTHFPTIRLAVRRQLADASAMFTREAELRPPTVPDDADEWTAFVTLESADTLGLIEKKNYHLDVQLTDDDGNRWQGVPDSVFHILPIVGQPSEPILPPLVDAGAPIAIGPAGLSVLHGDRPPLPSDGRDGESWIDESSPTRDIYGPKADGDWGSPFPLRGPEGPPGAGAVSTEDPLPVAAAADPGVGPEPSAWDHVHAHGNQAGGSLHAAAVAGVSAGFMTAVMATQLANLVAADFGAQIAVVASDLTTLAGTVAGHTSTLATHTSAIADLVADFADLDSALDTLTTSVADHTGSIATLTSDLSALTATVGGHASTLASHTSSIATNTSDIASLTSTVAGLSAVYVPQTRTLTPGAGLVGSAALDLSANRTLAIGQNADNSITVNADDIQLSTTLQTAISTNTSNIASLTSTVSGLSAVYVPLTRTITPGAGLVGASALDLSANRTLDVGANADGSIVVNANDIQVGVLATDAQHGNRGGGALHANVVAAGAAGFMTGAQATALATATTNIATNTSSISALGAVKYIVQVADAAVPNAQATGALATGILKNTITTGVLSIAGAADMPAPGGQLGGTYASATVLGIRETAGPTLLTFGAIADGEFLKRVGTTVVSAAAGGGSGADALGSYIVQTATNKPVNAQVLAALATGFAKVTITTGVVSTQATIAGTDLSGFTDTTLPVANSSGQLTSSVITLASNTLTYAASVSGGTLAFTLSNTSNTASSAATLTVKTGGATAADPSLVLSTTVTDWKFTVDNGTNDRFRLLKGASELMRLDPSASFNQTQIYTTASIGTSLSAWPASGNSRVGVAIFGLALSSNNYLNIGPDTAGGAGKGVAGIFNDGTNWQNAISWTHVSGAGTGLIKLMENGGRVTALGTTTVASASGAVWDGFDHQAATLTLSGSTSVTTATGVNYVDIKQPTITAASALSVAAAATVRIAGAPLAAGSATLTKSYSLWIDAGLPRIDSSSANGSVATVLGAVGPTGANTTVQEWLTVDLNGTTRYLPCF